MGGTGEVLTHEEIVFVNALMIEWTGGLSTGDENLLNPGSLDYILGACQGSYFGLDLYPTVIGKAVAIAERIMTAHVFHDGNKRTAMEVCRLMLERNGYHLQLDLEESLAVALQVAKKQITLEEFTLWITKRATPLT